MGKSPLVTVIVPVYNTAPYLKECFASISSQTYQRLEIIAVDDGSTDGNAELLDEISDLDRRVIVIHQKNSGVSATRNMGINFANGEYIVFSDSDDIMGNKNIEYLVAAEAQTHAQLCVSTQFHCFDTSAELCKYENSPFSIQESNAPILKLTSSVWGNLYSTELIRRNQILFDHTLHNKEDGLFNIEYQLHTSKCAVVTGPVTFYRQREGSITTKCADLRWEAESLYLALMALCDACKSKKNCNKWAILNRRIWVNGYYATVYKMKRDQRRMCRKFDWSRTKYIFQRSGLGFFECLKELILSTPCIENAFIYPKLIWIRSLLNG